jgi:replicative DNA helicase
VIGSLLIDHEKLDDMGGIKPDDFYDSTNAGIFREIATLHAAGQPVQVDLLRKHLPGDNWAERIYEIARSVPVAAHAEHYAKIVLRLSTLRRLRFVASELLTSVATHEADPETVLERAESLLASIGNVNAHTAPVSLHDATLEASTAIDAIFNSGESTGVLTGLQSFDTDMGGLFPGELIILAARPGLGKTSLALQVAYHIASRSRLVYFASLEMSATELSTRLACSISGVSSRLVRTGKLEQADFQALNEGMTAQAAATMDIHDQPGMTVAGIRRQIRQRKKHGLKLAVIDYLQLLTPEDRKIPREQQVARMTTLLKQTAREYEIPILCLCQLNRMADGEEEPQLSHLRESGAIEQDADMVLFLAPHKPTDLRRNNATLCVKKNRNGEVNNLPLDWHPSRTRFTCTQPISEGWTG